MSQDKDEQGAFMTDNLGGGFGWPEDGNGRDAQIDKYRHIAIVDCSQVFSNNECLVISDQQKQATYLNSSSEISFKFDTLISRHEEVERICNRLSYNFLSQTQKEDKDKVLLNVADQFNTNNNSGFNLTNFQVKFINQYFQDVINDYDKSFIGTFSKCLFKHMDSNEQFKANHKLYFTITKFENDVGFSLVHQDQG